MKAPLCPIDFIMCWIDRLFKISITAIQAALNRYNTKVASPSRLPNVLTAKLFFSVEANLSIAKHDTYWKEEPVRLEWRLTEVASSRLAFLSQQ